MEPRTKFYVLLLLVMLPLLTNGQSAAAETKIPDCSVSRTKPKLSKYTPMSAGVLNGRALSLVKPVYSAAAKSVHARGVVLVSVLIDEAGCVIEANAHSGHPLLIPSSITAAKASVFEPFSLSGKPVRVNGVITYNYLPNSMNWLELGFNSDSFEKLAEYLPERFDLEAKLLRQSNVLPWDQKQKVLDSVKNSLTTNLIKDPKAQWLFSVGIDLNALSTGRWGTLTGEKAWTPLRSKMDAIPNGVSTQLRNMLNELLTLTNATEIDKKLRAIQLRLFDLGN